MQNRLPLFLAFRFNRGRKRSGLVSAIAIFSTIGIALGVAVLIIGLSAMNGFEKELKERVLAVVPHGEVIPVVQPAKNWSSLQENILKSPHVLAVAPVLQFTALVENGMQIQAIQIKGIDKSKEEQMSSLATFVPKEQWQAFEPNSQQIILGKGVIEKLKVQVGDWVTLMIPDIQPGGSIERVTQPKRIRVQVIGLLDLVGDLGYSFAIVPLTDAQNYLDYGDGISNIEIRVKDIFKADKMMVSIGQSITEPVYITSWIAKYGKMYRDIQLVRVIMYLAMILVIGVASFNIVSTLIMAIKDKRGDIAVLKTLGATDNLIRATFIWYGLLTGLIGCFLGLLLGVFVSLKLTDIIHWIETLTQSQFMSGGVYFIDFLPSELHLKDLVVVVVTTLFLSLIASWYPAQRACKIEPARVLSGQ